MDDYDVALEMREEGTGQWIFEEPTYIRWRECQIRTALQGSEKVFGDTTLWIQGLPPMP
jgi:hypothetical protein